MNWINTEKSQKQSAESSTGERTSLMTNTGRKIFVLQLQRDSTSAAPYSAAYQKLPYNAFLKTNMENETFQTKIILFSS